MLTKNVKIMLLLIVIALLYTFVFGCDDTAGGLDPVVIHNDGTIENLDTNIEKVTEPLLDFGDNVVKEARDAEKGFLGGLFEATSDDDDDDDNFSDLQGIGNMKDRSTP
jgi:hypothetical protein